MGKLSKAALAQMREAFRDEIRIEMLRILNPTFLQLVTDGKEEMTKIFDAVMTFSEELDELQKAVEINTKAIEKLQEGSLDTGSRRITETV